MKFKAPIEVESSLVDSSNSSGSAGQVLTSTGVGVDWIDPTLLPSESAEKVIQTVRLGEAVSKGDPLVITGYHGSNGPAIVERADATDATKMPAYGVALEDYANNATGLMIAVGDFDDFDTSSYSVGDTLYVAVGGGMTNVKPTGTALIQNMGIVSRSNANNGDVEIVAIGRTNDVPNLPTGRLFVGTAANTSLTSDVVYVDDANDRVGIGTTSPATKLHVSGGDIRIDDTERIEFGAGGVRINNDAAGRMYHRAPLGFYWETNGGYRMVLNSSGNVGIGTTSPDTKLEVSSSSGGVLRLTSTDTSVATGESIGRVEFKSNDASTGGNNVMGFVDCLATNAGSTYALTFGTGNAAAATEKMRISQTGNVGMGTTNLTTISAAVTTLSLGSTVASTSGGIAFQANGVVKAYNYVAGNYLYNQTATGVGQIFYGAGSEQMRIHNTTGNVGIGITNPQTKLHLGKVSNSASTIEELRIETGTSSGFGGQAKLWLKNGQYGVSTIGLGPEDGTGNPTTYIKYEDYDNKLYITTNSSARIFIDNLGNVGVGTVSPSYRLDVLGDGRFTNGTHGTVHLGNYGQNISSNYGYIQTSSSLRVNGSVKVSDDTNTPGSSRVGSIRYRTSGNNSYVDMCMQTGASTYAWVNIVTNSW